MYRHRLCEANVGETLQVLENQAHRSVYTIGVCSSSLCFSKPITYGITLSELSEEEVHQYQGREPSGRKMDEIVLDYNSKCTCSRRSSSGKVVVKGEKR